MYRNRRKIVTRILCKRKIQEMRCTNLFYSEICFCLFFLQSKYNLHHSIMAKKISKHSRAARRGLIDAESSAEVKSLESLPRENSGVKKSIIRTTIKNENLLNKKLEKNRIKKTNKKKTSALKHKLERSGRLSGVLETKIEKSIARAKYVQNARKSGWDKINQGITINSTDAKKPTSKDDDDDEDIMVEEEEEEEITDITLEIKDDNRFRALQLDEEDDE